MRVFNDQAELRRVAVLLSFSILGAAGIYFGALYLIAH